jgi:hypothetical protein
MQTFLPYSDFAASADALDPKRLQKQIVETFQIMKALTIPEYGWKHHPAVRMWRGHAMQLSLYQNACVAIRAARGWDTLLDMPERTLQLVKDAGMTHETALPEWLGHEEFHHSHRSNLVRKDVAYYGPQFPDGDPTAPYVWPVDRTGEVVYYLGAPPPPPVVRTPEEEAAIAIILEEIALVAATLDLTGTSDEVLRKGASDGS